MPKIFEVGGCVRDELMGVETNDIDFTFVLDNLDRTVEEGFQLMTVWLQILYSPEKKWDMWKVQENLF